jgi:Holliday junction resolvase RusA-like endonuclease
LELRPPDKRRRDVDNVAKAVLDALQIGGWLTDDSMQVVPSLHIDIAESVAADRGTVTVIMESLQ